MRDIANQQTVIDGLQEIWIKRGGLSMSESFPLEELRALLNKAKAVDKYCYQFGAKSHQYQWNPPASVEEVEEFEQKIGVRLPEEYRDFLLLAGNGGAGPYYGLFSLQKILY
jgi:hypothetical protein